MNKEVYQTLSENILAVSSQLESMMWDLHRRLCKEYDSKFVQFEDAKKIGKFAEAILHCNNVRSIMSELRD